MKNLTIFIFLVSVFISCTPQTTTPTLDTDQIIEDIRTLSSDEMQGRLVGTEGNAMAREYIINRFQEMELPVFQGSYEHNFSVERNNGDLVEGTNIIGVVKGESDSMIVITAHYDHLGVRDTLIFNGADDNASGTSGLLAMADYFTQVTPKHTLVFAALDAEEGGLNGARAFVRDSTLMEKVVLNINMDMISQNDKNELYAVGTYHYPELKPILETIDTGELSLLFGHDRPEDGNQDWTFASDHGPFHAAGIPFVYFGVEDHEHYHQPSDTFETIPKEFYKNSVQLILNAVLALDNK